MSSNDKQESYHANKISIETLQKEIETFVESNTKIELEKRHEKGRIKKLKAPALL